MRQLARQYTAELKGQLGKYEAGGMSAPDMLDMFRGLVLTGLIKTMPKPYRDVAEILVRERVIKGLNAANDN